MTEDENVSSLPKLLQSLRERMLADFRGITAQLPHMGAKGEAREQVLIDFLRSYLPGRFGVEHGFVVSSKGNVSNQIDVVIYDQHITPVFRTVGNHHLFPVESVLATVEVKSYLNSQELIDALNKTKKIKSFERTGPQIVGGFRLNSGDAPPPAGFIFAFDSIKLSTLTNSLYDYNRHVPRSQWINMICSLEKGIITYVNASDLLNISTGDAQQISMTSVDEAGSSLAIFYAHLVTWLTGTVAISANMFEYTNLAKTSTADKPIDY